MKLKFLLISIILFLFIGLPFTCQYIEEPFTHYDIFTKDLHNGGWVPEIFPSDITDIYEQHDIDTNQVWLRFTLGTTKINVSNLISTPKSEIKVSKPFLTSWWFNNLSNDYKYYKGSDLSSTFFLALSEKSKTVYWWRND